MYDVVVIGCGPAGMTAAIYAKRSNMNVIILERSAPGGQINQTSKIENYPGFLEIDGPSLATNIFNQIQKLGIIYRYGNVMEIYNEDNHKVIKTDKETILTKAVIIATGRRSKKLGLENENTLTGRGISWCAICDGPLYKDKEVVVLGGGNSACEEGLYLADIAKKVTLIHRRDTLRADNFLVEKILNNPKVEIVWNSEVIKINEENNKLVSIDIKNNQTNEENNIKCDGMFIYIGQEPVTNMLEKYNIVDEFGYIIVDENMRTNEKGIYACGDVIRKELYQVATSVGEGALAAMSVVRDQNN